MPLPGLREAIDWERRHLGGAWKVPGQDLQDTQDNQDGVAGAKRGPLAILEKAAVDIVNVNV